MKDSPWSRPANYVTGSRILLTLFAYCVAWLGYKSAFAVLFIAAGLTDAIDGIVARCWGGPTEFGRWFDSFADYLYYFSIPVWIFLLWPEVLFENQWWFFFLFLGYAVSLFFQLFWHGQLLRLHSVYNKAASVIVFLSISSLFVFGDNVTIARIVFMYLLFTIGTDIYWMIAKNKKGGLD